MRTAAASLCGPWTSAVCPKRKFHVPTATPVYTPATVIDPHSMPLAHLASDTVLDAAYVWLCYRRRDYPADADVWSLRRHWPMEKKRLRADLLAGIFRFGLLDRITLADGGDIDLWSARDALVLKALAMVLAVVLPVSPRCAHVKAHGGAKAGGAPRNGAAWR